MGRSPCCGEGDELKKGPWTQEEDEKLVSYVKNHGDRNWRALPKNAGLNRCGKSCRLRWSNYLRPDIKRGRFSEEEEDIIIKLHSVLGNKWSRIATHLPGRTDNEIKNYWNANLKKKLLQMGIDPVTHRPRSDLNLIANLSELVSLSINSNPSYDINALRLQSNAAEAAKLQLLQSVIQLLGSSSSTPSINQYSTALLGLPTYPNNQHSSLITTGVLSEIAPINCVRVSSAMRSETGQHGAPTEGELPGLISGCSTGTSSASENASGNGNSGDGSDSINKCIADYDLVDGWEKLIDDGNSTDSFWSDLLNHLKLNFCA